MTGVPTEVETLAADLVVTAYMSCMKNLRGEQATKEVERVQEYFIRQILAANREAQAPEAQGVPNAAMEAMREASEFLWWPYWHGSGDRGTHVMRIKEPFSTNYSGEIAYFGNPGEGYDDPRHAAASALCDEHNAIVHKLRDALAALSQSQPVTEKGGAR